MFDWFKSERQKWATPAANTSVDLRPALPNFDPLSRELYEKALPRGVLLPRLEPDRPRENYWMSPHQLLRHRYVPGQLIVGKLGGTFLGHMDDRPMVTIAGARAGKTSTVLEPNPCSTPPSRSLHGGADRNNFPDGFTLPSGCRSLHGGADRNAASVAILLDTAESLSSRGADRTNLVEIAFVGVTIII